jgi:hypothetical protein
VRIWALAEVTALLVEAVTEGETVAGAVVFTTGVVGAEAVRVGEGAGGLVAVRDGAAVGFTVLPEGLPAEGEPPVVPPDVAVVVSPSGEGMSLPDCPGAGPSAWVAGPSPLMRSRPSLTPESSPEDAATAPTAIAAEETSSPVRTGWCLRRPRWPRGPGCGAADWS